MTEQALADFITILPIAGEEKTKEAIENLLTLAKKETSGRMYEYFLEQSEKYLYHPNSPYRNEEPYAAVLEYVIKHETEDINKVRPQFQLDDINKSRKGAIAADFTYTLHDGKRGTLHGIDSEYTLLFFHNPDCSGCTQTKAALESSLLITEMANRGRLAIIALYSDGKDSEWEACRSAIPAGWINARDGSDKLIIKEKLYAIHTIPSLYLLDRDKRVVFKDTTGEQVLDKLQFD